MADLLGHQRRALALALDIKPGELYPLVGPGTAIPSKVSAVLNGRGGIPSEHLGRFAKLVADRACDLFRVD